MASSACPSCGYENVLGARFCSSCGDRLRDEPADEVTAVHDVASDDSADGAEESEDAGYEMPDGTLALFEVRQGPKRGSRIALDSNEISIGRHPESDIFLDDVTVSRRHAVVRRVGEGFQVADAGSLNGTYVNQDRVEESALANGDEVQVGKFKLVYVALSPEG